MKDFFNKKEYLGDRQTIDIYKNCLSPFFIKYMVNHKNEDGTINKCFYIPIKTDIDIQKKHEAEINENYKPIIKDIKDYLRSEEELISNIFSLLFSCYNHDQVIKIGINKQFSTQNLYGINDMFKEIYKLKVNISNYKKNNEFQKAVDLKDYIVFRLDFLLTYFSENFCIQLKNTTIENYINDLILIFNNLINTEQIVKKIKKIMAKRG